MSAAPKTCGQEIKVLLVDDSTAFLESTMQSLRRHKDVSIVDIAFNAKDALWAVNKYKPDVIVLDVEMPDRSGLEILPELKAKSPDSKIIILTLFDNPAYRGLAEQAGADGFLTKWQIVRLLYPMIQSSFQDKQCEA